MKLSKIVELKNFASMLQNQFACRKFADFSGFQMVLKTPAHCSSHWNFMKKFGIVFQQSIKWSSGATFYFQFLVIDLFLNNPTYI